VGHGKNPKNERGYLTPHASRLPGQTEKTILVSDNKINRLSSQFSQGRELGSKAKRLAIIVSFFGVEEMN
jgi:hypothetical protein